MADTSPLLRCTYGAGAFVLDDYDLKVDAVVKAGVGRTGTKIQVKGNGFVDAADADTFAAKLAAVAEAFGYDGQSFEILGLAGRSEVLVLAPLCQDGGPHVGFEIKSGAGPLYKRVSFTLDAVTGAKQPNQPPNTPPSPVDSYKVKTATGPDGLRVVTRSGEINGTGAPAAFDQVLSDFQDAYAPPDWVVKFEVEYPHDLNKAKATYTLTAQELANPLPPDAGQTSAVEGEVTTRKERDEQHRLTTVYEFDLLLDGDPAAFHETLRPKGKTIVRESFSAAVTRGVRLRSSFTTVESGDNNGLLSWQQSVKWVKDQTVYEELLFAGADPVAVARPKTLGKLHQSGSATGQGKFPSQADPLSPTFAELPEVTFEDKSDVDKVTSWVYVMFAFDPVLDADVGLDPTTIGRPTKTGFYGGKAQ